MQKFKIDRNLFKLTIFEFIILAEILLILAKIVIPA